MEEDNIRTLEKFVDLSEKEKIGIKSLLRGECLNFVGNNHISLSVCASEYEKKLLSERL